MSYTPPAPNAADFGFTGSVYTSSSNFSWDPRARTCASAGFSPTRFGAPASAFWQILTAGSTATTAFGTTTHVRGQTATGAANASFFGLPKAARGGSAAGFQSFLSGVPTYKIDWQVTNFGRARLFPFHVAPGWVSTQFGTPKAAAIKWVTTLGKVTHLGMPATQSSRSGSATGFGPTRFGTAFAQPLTPPNLSQTLDASGWAQTMLGAPTAMPEQFGFATGFAPTQLPAPASVHAQPATGLHGTVFGASTSRLTAHPAGFITPVFGAPQARLLLAAAGAHPATRWGIPHTVRSNTFLTTGRSDTWFGHPSGSSRLNKPATGFSATHLGAPTCRRRNHAAMTPPATAFGTPLLKRNTQC